VPRPHTLLISNNEARTAAERGGSRFMQVRGDGFGNEGAVKEQSDNRFTAKLENGYRRGRVWGETPCRKRLVSGLL